MKTKLVMLMLTATFATAAHASGIVLPDACGKDEVRFKVDLNKKPPALTPPPAGSARVVFIEKATRTGSSLFKIGVYDYITRFGLDGAWVGAATNDSYLTIDIPPGKHHVCSSVQVTSGVGKDMIGATSFTAEAGTVYYFQFSIDTKWVNNVAYRSSSFTQVTEDEGEFRVKALALSTSTPDK
jgi:hypothetical protein